MLRLLLHPELAHWEWEGDEQALIAMLEKQEREKESAEGSA